MVFWSLLALHGCTMPSSHDGAVADPPLAPSQAAPTPSAQPVPAPVPAPAFQPSVRPLGQDQVSRMQGQSHHPGCPVEITDLRAVHMNHWTFEGTLSQGVLIVHHSHTQTVVDAFAAAFEARFPFESMQPVSVFEGSDDASMAANNTSAYNCRKVKGSTTFSEHSYGRAIDVNPVHNPWVRGDRVDPAAGQTYLERQSLEPGMLGPDSALVVAFKKAGWGWGGDWSSLKDYQHLSASGR